MKLRPCHLAALALCVAAGATRADKWLSVDKASGQGVYVWDSGMRYEGGVVQGTTTVRRVTVERAGD